MEKNLRGRHGQEKPTAAPGSRCLQAWRGSGSAASTATASSLEGAGGRRGVPVACTSEAAEGRLAAKEPTCRSKEVCGLTAAEAREEIHGIQDLRDADTQNQLDWATTASERGRFDRQAMTFTCDSLRPCAKKSGLEEVHTVRHALKTKTPQIKSKEICCAIRLSPRRWALPQAQPRFLNVAVQHGPRRGLGGRVVFVHWRQRV